MINPLILMVSVAGEPDRETVGSYLSTLKTNGIDQVLIYPRSGCRIPYLSERWFALIGDFIFHARQLNMRIWLYDDFNWPSGDAAGKVTLHPEYCLRAIRITGADRGQIVSSANNGDHLYFGEKAFTDLMSEEAVAYFIQCTHRQYYERFSGDFGTTIAGIFTDEPAVGYVCDNHSIPYYDGLPEDYRRATGRDLFSDIRGEHPALTADAMAVIGKRFRSNYIDRLTRWCKDHGIIMTGHLMNDSAPFHSVRANGDLLRCLSGFMLPGVDEIDSSLTNRWLLPLLGAAEYAAGDHGAMAELFALGPCELPYSTKLRMLFLAACFKIDHYFLAISHMDFCGNRYITDFFQHFGIDQPDFEGIRLLGQQAKLAARYARKDFQPDVYIRYPTRVCAENLLTGSNAAPLAQLLCQLAYRQIQWKFLAYGEMPTDAPILEFDRDFRYRLGDTVTDDAALIAAMLPITPLVCHRNGQLPEGIFVRKYPDGDYILVNLSGTAGVYLVDGKPVDLGEHRILTAHTNTFSDCTAMSAAASDFRLSFDRPNITRVICAEGSSGRIVCDQPQSVIFAVRKGERILVNGETVIGKNPTQLSFGFRELYADSMPVTLRKGDNLLQAENDFCFLPTVFLLGDFIATDTGDALRLSRRPVSLALGARVESFGVALLEQDIFIPENARAIKLSGTALYAKVYANGSLLGEAVAAPYVFDITPFRGLRVQLKILQHASMAPMFGDSDRFPRKGTMFKKRLDDRELLFGLDEVSFLL